MTPRLAVNRTRPGWAIYMLRSFIVKWLSRAKRSRWNNPPEKQQRPPTKDTQEDNDGGDGDRNRMMTERGTGTMTTPKKVKKKRAESNGSSRHERTANGSGSGDQQQQQHQIQTVRRKNAYRRQQIIDDDDFSVAPSVDQDVKYVSERFDDVYQRGRKLGLGAFAVVFIGTHRPTKAEYAVKQIDRSTMIWDDRDALQDEIANLYDIDTLKLTLDAKHKLHKAVFNSQSHRICASTRCAII